MGAAGNRDLRQRGRGRHRIDEVGVKKDRRAREHTGCDLRLIGGKPHDHGGRRVLASGERLGEGHAHQRRGIIQRHDQRGLGGGAVVRGQIGVQIGARESGNCVRALASRCAPHPLQKLPNDHASNRRHQAVRIARHRRGCAG